MARPHTTIQRNSPPFPQARVKAVAEIVDKLVRGVQQGSDVDLNFIKREATSKYTLARAPKLVDIIAAVPEEYKATLLPQCAACQSHQFRTNCFMIYCEGSELSMNTLLCICELGKQHFSTQLDTVKSNSVSRSRSATHCSLCYIHQTRSVGHLSDARNASRNTCPPCTACKQANSVRTCK